MKLSKHTLNILSATVITCILLADYVLVSSTEHAVQADCKTKVAYDKSGSMFCVAVIHVNKTLVASQP